MASDLLKFHLQATIASTHLRHLQPTKTLSPFLTSPVQKRRQQQQPHHQSLLSFFPQNPQPRSKVLPFSIHCSLSSPTPPTSKEEAVFQAKACLSTALEKPLNNPRLTGMLKKLKQPRFRVEIPLIQDSPLSVSQLAFDVFGDIPIRKKGSPVKILHIWSNPSFTEAANETFDSKASNQVEHVDISSITDRNGGSKMLNSADIAVFIAPEASQVAAMKTVTDILHPKPVVIFNPGWGFEEESSLGGLSGFVGSFEVVYSFTGLEVKGILSSRKGVIFKCVRDGVLSGERWTVLVEEGGELRVVSAFKARPSIGEVETVLYNLMAVNSPITKSAKFLKDLVSNVTGKK